jgi:23S rRNA (guanosine2251-2'-O)-methyltransferase
MTFDTIEYYECENPGCRLRFPVYQGMAKPKLCPLCRSSLRVALTTTNMQEVSRGPSIDSNWNLEVLMDNIRSAWNVGAILRTSEGMGITQAYCCGITPAPDNQKVAKTALGAEFTINWQYHRNAVELARFLKSDGRHLWALEVIPSAIPLYDVEFLPQDAPVVLVMGNENCGVDPAIIDLCEKVISIPMLGNKQSYNVAVAYGMAVSFLLYRQSVSQGSLRILPST